MKLPQKLSVIDDTCLTPLFQHVQFPLVKHTDRIKHVGLILKVLFQLTFCVALLVHPPGLPSV